MKTLFFLCLTLATCRLYAQDTTLLRHLPPDAVAIYHFNGKVLTFKLPWQDLADRIPPPRQNTHDRELAAILRDPRQVSISENDLYPDQLRRPRHPGNAPTTVTGDPYAPMSHSRPSGVRFFVSYIR